MRAAVGVVIVGVVVGAAALPADAAPGRNGGCVESNTHHVGAQQRQITLRPGQCVQLKLATASDGGYAWHTTRRADRAVARVVSIREAPPKLAPGEVGGESTTYYLYQRVASGTTTLTVRQEQVGHPQQGDDVVTLTIRVR